MLDGLISYQTYPLTSKLRFFPITSTFPVTDPINHLQRRITQPEPITPAIRAAPISQAIRKK